MQPSELQQLLAQAEHKRLEFKRAIRPDNAARIISALANSDGGYLIIGVDENQNNRVHGVPGVPNPVQTEATLRRAAQLTDPPVPITVRRHVLDGKEIIVAEVPDSRDTPHFYQGIAYERHEGQTIPVTAGRISDAAQRRLSTDVLSPAAEEEVLREMTRLATLVESLNRQIADSRSPRNRYADVFLGGTIGAVLSVVLSLLLL